MLNVLKIIVHLTKSNAVTYLSIPVPCFLSLAELFSKAFVKAHS